jgi:hypothetical protein
MADLYPPARQREALLRLVEALWCREAVLRRDECGDWRVNGKLGSIYATPGMTTHGLAPGEGFHICFRGAEEFEEPPKGSKAWSFAKQAMTFTEVALDCDTEGVLFLRRLPTPEEAAIIRDKLGVPKKREVSDAERERLRVMAAQHGFASRSTVGSASDAPETASDASSAPSGPETPADQKAGA